MIKKSTSKQNIAIIILSVLLTLSIIFGSTYSYFNGSSNELISGTVTTATLSVSLFSEDATGQTTPFSLHTPGSKVIPGQSLNNTALQINNTSPFETYMIVVYTLNFVGGDGSIEPAPKNLSVMDIQDDAVGSGWRKCVYTCRNGEDKISCLVYLGGASGNGNGVFGACTNGTSHTAYVLSADCLKVPTDWGNAMQNKTISVSFTAYIIQKTALEEIYPDIVNADLETRTSAITSTIISECTIDTTVAPIAP